MAEKPYIYLPPYRNLTSGASVIGSTDIKFPPEYLVDGRHNRPVFLDGGILDLDVTLAAADDADLLVLSHTSLNQDVNVSGDIAGTIPPDPDYAMDQIPLNGFLLLDAPVNVGSFTLQTSGNTKAVIGEAFVGESMTLRPFLLGDAHWSYDDYANPPMGATLQSLPYSTRASGRVFNGSQLYSDAECNELYRWWRSTEQGTKLSVIIPDPDVNDPWTVQFLSLSWDAHDVRGHKLVQMSFREYPRIKW